MGEERDLPGSGSGGWPGDLRKAEQPVKAKGVGQGLCEGQGRGWGTPRGAEGRISASPEVLVAGCHFFQQIGNVVRGARHVAGLDPARRRCWCCCPPPPPLGLLLSLAAAPASRVAARRRRWQGRRLDGLPPPRRGVGLSRGKQRPRGRPNDGAARRKTSSWAARSTAGSLRRGRHFHSGPSHSHSLRTRSLGQEAKTRLLHSGGGRGRRGTLRKAEVRVQGSLPTHAAETLGKGQSCWLKPVSIFAWPALQEAWQRPKGAVLARLESGG